MAELANTLDAIKSLDLSPFNAKAETLANEIAEIRSAIAKADARRIEIGAELAKSTEANAEAVAAALVSGEAAESAAEAAPDRARLLVERENLREAAKALEGRLRDAQTAEQTNRDAARDAIREVLQPVEHEIRQEAREAATRLVDCYAAARAIDDALRGYAGLVLQCRQAVEGVAGMNRLLDYRREVPVPPNVIDLISHVARLGPAVDGVRARTQIGMP